MKLQRYELIKYETDEYEAGLAPSPQGPVIYHSEALDWFESIIGVPIPYYFDRQEQHGMLAERARLRALIAAERGK